MKKIVPKKNVSEHVADIKRPGGNRAAPDQKGNFDEETISEFLKSGEAKSGDETARPFFALEKAKKAKSFFLKFVSFSAFSVLAVLVLLGAGVYANLDSSLGRFNSASGKLDGLLNKSDGGKAPAETGNKQLTVLDLMTSKDIWGNVGSVYSGFQNFSIGGIGLIQEVNVIAENWPNFLFKGGGRELISHLKEAKKHLASISGASSKLSSLNIGFTDVLAKEYGSPLLVELGLRRADNFLAALINWLSSDSERHILILFGNSSELRPGGGFIGSYADVTFAEGSVKSVETRGINDPDKQLKENIVPPKPLQAISRGWTIADSNWFFDYELSAGKTIELMEKSAMYAGRVSFDGAVAVSPKVVGDMLELTGPLELPERNLTINKDNFLTEIQKEVQAAQAKGAPSKKIIAELLPELLLKMSSLPPEDTRAMAGKLAEWTRNKELMIYFKDAEIRNFLDFYGVSGKIFELPSDFNGDYLAVSSANVGGGKSDLFVNQEVFFKTQINLDGTASDHLEISRKHTAGKSADWWYRVPNESYVEVFSTPGASLAGFSGGWNRKINPKTDYNKNGYRADPLVASIESTLKKNFNYPLVDEFKESEKEVFGVWVKTEPGQTTKTVFDYSVHLFSPPADGQKYQFVFEKQAASSGKYKFEIYAPAGFYWKESNSPVFEYQTSDPEGRIVFSLTMENA